jgi:hypothetical protein
MLRTTLCEFGYSVMERIGEDLWAEELVLLSWSIVTVYLYSPREYCWLAIGQFLIGGDRAMNALNNVSSSVGNGSSGE